MHVYYIDTHTEAREQCWYVCSTDAYGMCKHPVSVRCKTTISHLFQTASDFSIRTLIYIRCAVDGTKSSVFYPTSSEEVGCSYTMNDGPGHDSPYGFKVMLPAGMYVYHKHLVSFITLQQSVFLCQFFVKQSEKLTQWANCIDSWLANESNLQWFGRIKTMPAEDLKSIFDKPGPPDIYPVDVFIYTHPHPVLPAIKTVMIRCHADSSSKPVELLPHSLPCKRYNYACICICMRTYSESINNIIILCV